MRLFYLFLKSSSAAELIARHCIEPFLPSSRHIGKEETLRVYFKDVSYNLQNNTTHNASARPDFAQARYAQSPTLSPTQYVEAVVR